MALLRKTMAILMVLVMVASCAAAEEMLRVNADLLRLANSTEPLSEDYEPEDLVKLASRRSGADAKGTVYTESATSIQLRREAADALVKLCEAAEGNGVILYVRQGYRSYADEEARYTRMAKRGTTEQKPGENDYQTGLAVTVVGKTWKSKALNAQAAETQEGVWLLENAAAYGFVLRYPENKAEKTGWEYAPWHLRYVGAEAAAYMNEHDLCLEEFVELLEPENLAELPVQETQQPDETEMPPDEIPAQELTEETPAPTQIPAYEEGQLIELEETGPDGDYEISFFHK